MLYCPTNTALTRLFPFVGFQIITETKFTMKIYHAMGLTSYLTDALNMTGSLKIATFIGGNLLGQ